MCWALRRFSDTAPTHFDRNTRHVIFLEWRYLLRVDAQLVLQFALRRPLHADGATVVLQLSGHVQWMGTTRVHPVFCSEKQTHCEARKLNSACAQAAWDGSATAVGDNLRF